VRSRSPRAANHIEVCAHLAKVFGGNYTITRIPGFSRLADAGMAAMDLMAGALDKDTRVSLPKWPLFLRRCPSVRN